MGKFDDLPKEMIPEILSRFPTEAVLDSKLVCKPWRDVVHLPSFSQKHLNHLISADDESGKLSFVFLNRVITGVEFCYAEYDENSPETPFSRKLRIDVNLQFYYSYTLVGSCNGLICIDSWHSDMFGPTYIFNPVTREYITLPMSKGNYWWTGFGYIPSTNEYKVVRVYDTTNVRTIHVYTLGSNNGWRNVGTMDRDMPFYRKDGGAFANGALHWADDQGTVLAFDLIDEKFSKLPSPPFSTRTEFISFPISLGVLGDLLSATYCRDGLYDEIWLLKRNKDNYDGLSWSKEFSFDVSTLRSLPPFGLTKRGRLLCYENHKIYGYDSEASSAKNDVDFGKSITDAIPHKNTLISLKILGEKDAKTMKSGVRAISNEEIENNDSTESGERPSLSEETENNDSMESGEIASSSEEIENNDSMESGERASSSDETENNNDSMESGERARSSEETENNDSIEYGERASSSEETENNHDSMESGERASSSEETENNDSIEYGERASSSDETENNNDSMESGERASSSEETENNDSIEYGERASSSEETKNSD